MCYLSNILLARCPSENISRINVLLKFILFESTLYCFVVIQGVVISKKYIVFSFLAEEAAKKYTHITFTFCWLILYSFICRGYVGLPKYNKSVCLVQWHSQEEIRPSHFHVTFLSFSLVHKSLYACRFSTIESLSVLQKSQPFLQVSIYLLDLVKSWFQAAIIFVHAIESNRSMKCILKFICPACQNISWKPCIAYAFELVA